MSLPQNVAELVQIARVAEANREAGDWVNKIYADDSFFVDSLMGPHKLIQDPKPVNT